jgi:hypothetical protein
MKRLFYIFSIIIAFIAINPVHAQTTQQIFNTKIAEYEVGVKRNVPAVAQTSFNAAMTMVNDEIASVTQQILATTNPTVIATLTAKKNAMVQIQTDLQGLQSNLTTNFVQIKAKMNDFSALL